MKPSVKMYIREYFGVAGFLVCFPFSLVMLLPMTQLPAVRAFLFWTGVVLYLGFVALLLLLGVWPLAVLQALLVALAAAMQITRQRNRTVDSNED